VDALTCPKNIKLMPKGHDHFGPCAFSWDVSCMGTPIGAEHFMLSPYGIEVHSLKVDGRYLDEILMVKRLI
jgi:hypothetical protein